MESSTVNPSQRNVSRLAPALLIGGFVLAMLPLADSYILYHPDERHYSDAALQMLRDGQWLSPRRADGSYRFRKPILPYWAAAGGMAMLGSRPLAPRIIFLLATAAVIYMTYHIALLIYRKRRTALLAGVIVATNGALVLTSARSMPDALILFCTTLSILGFTAILVAQRSERRWYWMAYVGAGLAFASKGSLGPLVVAYFFGAALFSRREHAVKSLLHLPSMITGVLLGLTWYALTLLIHGSDMWDQFWYDQLGHHLRSDSSDYLQNLAYYCAFYLLQFLLWILVLPELLLRNRGIFRPRSARHRFADRVAIGWLVLIAVVFSFSIRMYNRYTLCAIPLGAVLLAGLFHLANPQKRQAQQVRGIKLTVAALILVATAVAWINFSLGRSILAVTMQSAGILLGTCLLLGSRNERCIPRSLAIGLAILALVPTLCLGLGQLVLPDQSEQIVRTLHDHQLLRGQPDHQPIVIIGRADLASRIRVFTSGNVALQRYSTKDTSELRQAIRSAQWILASKQTLADLDLTGWSYVTAAHGLFPGASPSQIYRDLRQGLLGQLIRSPKITMVLAHRDLPSEQP